ncbi:MAG: protein translocase subunit SecDF [Simkaniaceae bacterium]
MEKQRRWQLILIIAVIALTIYNILPTIFFYSKPLKAPIGEKRAAEISLDISKRVNHLEKNAIGWIHSFCKLLHVTPKEVVLDSQDPEFIRIQFKNLDDAKKFRQHLPRAGSLIPFIPEQLSLVQSSENEFSKNVLVQRNIPIRFDKNDIGSYFSFSGKWDNEGHIAPLYQKIISDRLFALGITIGGESENAALLQAVLQNPKDPANDEYLYSLAQNINSYSRVFSEQPAILHRFFATFTQGEIANKPEAVANLIAAFDSLRDRLKLERISLENEEQKLTEQKEFLTSEKEQRLRSIKSKENRISNAIAAIKTQKNIFAGGQVPFNPSSLKMLIERSFGQISKEDRTQFLDVSQKNPLIAAINLDWENETIFISLHPDILELRNKFSGDRAKKDNLDQLIFDEVARVSRESSENLTPYRDQFQIALNELANSKSFLALNLGEVAAEELRQLKNLLQTSWNPKHPDLNPELFPILDYEAYQKLPKSEQKLGIVLYSPSLSPASSPKGFKESSVYVIAKGIEPLLQKVRMNPESPQSKQFFEDFKQLQNLLFASGFIGYPGTTYPFESKYSQDFLFEKEDFYQMLLKATRENFHVHGTKKYAILEFSDLQQRILTRNRIDTEIHEDLLKWKDEYNAAKANTHLYGKYDIPKPNQSPLLSNLKLSFHKYFRGDDRKILHWGLDLSGGKTVQIELRDSSGRIVTNDEDIKQGINELYSRVNKMGVSDVSIRREGSMITLDFPGAQGISAADLVKASSMYFNVVNEKFTANNPDLKDAVNRFLQEIWNEAVVTGKKDIESINQIAWNHLYGDAMDPDAVEPRTESAKILYENGLRLAKPNDTISTSAFNDSMSKIAMYRGDSFTQWQGNANPLVIVFKNFALEGSNLKNIHASYDPSKGNFLAFEIKGSQKLSSGEKVNPRSDLHSWTEAFSKEKISGTPLERFSSGKGWRMAVILNGSIISSPVLESALRDQVMITGSFTQREVNKLEADLKAGSLTFAPYILSEKNVSPELGFKERTQGILATVLALVLVIFVMIGYYRFAGLVASVAVLFNLLIMWATLQNINATITLAGIAGIILTVGMAVDANVLVFERIKEEFAISGRIAQAVQAGYKKAYSAIIDSNITTIIAALILLHFDSGPIKGFAVTLIIGIISSMFTALFMTRYFFAGWVQKPKHKKLTMSNLIPKTKFNFLKYTRLSIVSSIIVILIGGYLLTAQRNTIFGMDFTGGFALTVELEPAKETNYRFEVEKALVDAGASSQDIQVRELSPANHLRIFFSKSMDEKDKPFYGMPFEIENDDLEYSFENNPRITWAVQALEKHGIQLLPKSLETLDKSWVSISGQMSDTMRNNALIGLAIALFCIMVYITLRFEFKYAIAATLGLAHDILITMGVIGLLYALKVPVQIDLNTIAALMTIVGYSLNDTIIIFDRIREDVRIHRKLTFWDIINHALNTTLSRTIMTSSTTLLVLIALVAFGGSTIFGFSLVMSIGVIVGTFSSLFVASPLLLFFHKKELTKVEKVGYNNN